MSRERAIGVFTALVLLALAWVFSRSGALAPNANLDRAAVVPKRVSSPGPGLLSISAPAPSPRPSPSPIVAPPVSSRLYPEGSLCSFFESLGDGETHAVRDAAALERLDRIWSRDGTAELFRGLMERDWNEVADLERAYPGGATQELGLLARLRMFTAESAGIDRAGTTGRSVSLDPRDLEALIEMKWRDPENAFWPLVEMMVRNGEGMPYDRADELIGEASTKPSYRNPVTTFYAAARREVLDRGDDADYLAYVMLYSRAPIVSSGLFGELSQYARAGKPATERNRWLVRIGETMYRSQLPASGENASERFFDAWLGRSLAQRAGGVNEEPAARKLAYRRTALALGIEAVELDGSFANRDCDEEALRAYVRRLRGGN